MITLDSDIGVKKIRDLHAAILNEFNDNEEILIDFSAVERVDLSVVQLIIAAGREAKKTGKTLKLKSMPRTVKYQLQMCALKV